MAKRKVADIIVATLQAAGVKRCYGVVGDTLNHITDAIRRSDIDWVHMRHEVEGLMNVYTDLRNPDFAKLAEVIGFTAWRVERNEDLEAAVVAFLAHPGPALLDVHVNRVELVMPAKIEAAQVVGMALYSAKAVLSGHGGDVVDLVTTNFLG
jgi:pyruvate dehydrogenase (quinone)